MATTFIELLKAVKKSDPTFENLKIAETEVEFSARLLTAVGSLSDEAWASLPIDDQNWFNAAAVALNANEPVTIPGFDLSIADGSPIDGAVEVVEAPAAPTKGKAKPEKAIAAEKAKADKEAAIAKEKAEKAAAAAAAKAEKAEAAKAEKAEKAAKPPVEKTSGYVYVPNVDGSTPATLFLRQQIINNFLANKETDSKGLAAAAAAAGVVVNESTINTVFNHALGFLRAVSSLGANIVKK